MTNIVPHLWFDDHAEEAAKFYTSIIEDSRIGLKTNYLTETPSDRPKGSLMTIEFELYGQPFIALNGGPNFTFNPSISFIIKCSDENEVDRLWNDLTDAGMILMPLDTYPFSNKFGWLNDRYGVSWQIMHVDDTRISQKITPCLMFANDLYGRAEEAMNFYTSVFDESKIIDISHYGSNEGPNKKGVVKRGSITLGNLELTCMDTGLKHDFSFNEAVSLMVSCDNQVEIDKYWDALSEDPSAEQCGWLKDKFGVSWQIVPKGMNRMMNDLDTKKSRRAMEAILQMKKIDIAQLEQAFQDPIVVEKN